MKKSEDNLDNIRHSLAHLLAAAVLKLYPDTKLGIGPVIENGFYYDFKFSKEISPEILPKLEKLIKELIHNQLPFSGEKVTPLKAKKLFAKQPFKLDLIKELVKEKKPLTVYKTGDVFMDLCRGGHVKNTKEINPDAFKLTHLAGAYWRGDEKKPQLTRIYAVAFETKAELEHYLKMQEEAKRRDHRKLGKELKLFTVIDEVGPGLPLFYPNGAILRRLVENVVAEEQEKRGYQPIWIPHITRGELYKISGHLDKYDAMFPGMKIDKDDYYLKPMNCPHFIMLWKTQQWSYKDLPTRYTSTTTNYRYEKSGELMGLTRVRALTQDDCHVFCTEDQIESEIHLMVDMITQIYKIFGFEDYYVRISTSDPKHKEKSIGDPKHWKNAEAALVKIIEHKGLKSEIVPGEAAFYGPKLDFMFKDALDREWQLSTIQLDYNLPQRFNCEYVDAEGKKKQPVLIHRAILGSTERFLGILIEHLAGEFPVWLSPVQARILPISEKFEAYGKKVKDLLRGEGIRVELGDANETLGKRIRQAELEKIPYILVVGEKEMTNQTINVRHRKKGNVGELSLSVFLEMIEKEVTQKT